MLVDRDRSLLALRRDVVLHPVRAGMVTSPEPWRWRSDHALTGQAPAPDWLATDGVLSQLAATPEQARTQESQFVHDEDRQPRVWAGLQSQMD